MADSVNSDQTAHSVKDLLCSGLPLWILWPRRYKLFSCSTQLSIKFELHIKTKLLKNKYFSCLKT